MKAIALTLICLAAVLEASGDILLKKWALDGKHIFFIVGLIIYFAATVVWAFSLKYEFLSKAISIITIINLIIVVLVGVLYFKKRFIISEQARNSAWNNKCDTNRKVKDITIFKKSVAIQVSTYEVIAVLNPPSLSKFLCTTTKNM